jgi:hypothetical protein
MQHNGRAAAALAALLPRADLSLSLECRRQAPDGDCWICTREAGHRGPHVASGPQNQIYFAWED